MTERKTTEQDLPANPCPGCDKFWYVERATHCGNGCLKLQAYEQALMRGQEQRVQAAAAAYLKGRMSIEEFLGRMKDEAARRPGSGNPRRWDWDGLDYRS